MILFPPPIYLQATSAPAIPSTVEAKPGVFIVQGAPSEATFAALKAAGITTVFNLRTDAEGDFRFEEAGSKAAGAAYDHCPVDHAFSASAIDGFRAKLRALPPGSRILVHCASGNRAAAALLTAWVLDQHMPESEAIALARKSGLTNPKLEAAALGYVHAEQGREHR